MLRIGRSDEYRVRIATELAHLDQVGDEEFIRQSYLHLFHREPDPSGAAYYGEQLAAGAPRTQLIGAWAGSDEHVNRVVAEVYPNLSCYPGLGEGGDLLHAWIGESRTSQCRYATHLRYRILD